MLKDAAVAIIQTKSKELLYSNSSKLNALRNKYDKLATEAEHVQDQIDALYNKLKK